MGRDPSFAQLVSLACHDLRTPLATVHGFARTLAARADLGEPAARYLGIMATASTQLADLLDRLALAARIEGGRYDPELTHADTVDLARAAAAAVADREVAVAGEGAATYVDRGAVERAVADLARCALRHGGIDRVELRVDGPSIELTPVDGDVAPILTGHDPRDLGAAVAVRTLEALGGSIESEPGRLVVVLPASNARRSGS